MTTSEHLFPRWVAESMLADLEKRSARVERLYGPAAVDRELLENCRAMVARYDAV